MLVDHRDDRFFFKYHSLRQSFNYWCDIINTSWDSYLSMQNEKYYFGKADFLNLSYFIESSLQLCKDYLT